MSRRLRKLKVTRCFILTDAASVEEISPGELDGGQERSRQEEEGDGVGRGPGEKAQAT